ncbi:MAG: class I SAM-dependent DNA methyltransferase [Flavisolibacter sp.]
MDTTVTPPTAESFIARWKASGASERANYQLFLTELCELLGVNKPIPATDKVHEATYCFERRVELNDGEGKTTTNFIDLYKQHCFVLEAKQGSDKASITEAEILSGIREKTKTGTATRDTRSWEREMKKAKEQALRYARALPVAEGWPPFLVVVDVGYCIDLYADFARQGKTYLPFPDPVSYRIGLHDLQDEKIRERLRGLFTNPLLLDPGRRAARVTRELAGRLAKLASMLEGAGHSPEQVAGFLMRCLFTMFAEDVALLPENSFTLLLQAYRTKPDLLPHALEALWKSMDQGGFDPALQASIPQFNGFLFKEHEALPLSQAGIDLLIEAAKAGWGDVEPAIFGTLLERALQPRERHKLGAHYTPRAYVERLVMPTVIEPLREEWDAARAASAQLEGRGDEAGAREAIEDFHRRLCSVRVLDPACGSGNFLYVTLEHLKRLEGEVTEYLAHFPRQLGLDMSGGYTVTPAQLLGLEVNPRAAAIADVVLWIGYLQWHFRAHGHSRRLQDPILRQFGNIRLQDAVLSYSAKKERLDENGKPVSRWDGHSTKTHPVTGLEVPDETARTPVYDYIDPKPAQWPKADFIVGNPPFIGDKMMRTALGNGYVDALRNTYKGVLPESADYVMYWWQKAAELLKQNSIERFGFITTNSVKQSFNRRIIQEYIDSENPLTILYAIPDHPWVDSSDGAAVRIALTVVGHFKIHGRLEIAISEPSCNTDDSVKLSEHKGRINSDLSIGADLTNTTALLANSNLSSNGMGLYGSGFLVSADEGVRLSLQADLGSSDVIKPYLNGRDFQQVSRGYHVIDLFGFKENEVRDKYPHIYQHLLHKVKPERDQNNRQSYRKNWWYFGESRATWRPSLKGLNRYIATTQTSRHRVFSFIDKEIVIDSTIVGISLDDAFFLGVLSSRIHVMWAMIAGGRLGVGNDSRYNSTRCFQPYPFPQTTEDEKQQIRSIAEQLDAHRKERQALHPGLTITDMYNVLEKLRAGEALNAKEQKIHEQGLISILLQLHNELDAAVAAAYGWPADLGEEAILEKLVALNKERAAEEARGLVRWLRPEYQNPGGGQQTALSVEAKPAAAEKAGKLDWPETLAAQASAVQQLLQQHQQPVTAMDILNSFKSPGKAKTTRLQQVESLLETFSTLGLVRKTEDGGYVK